MNTDRMHYHENILEAIGHTPLVRLGRVERDEGLGSLLLTKVSSTSTPAAPSRTVRPSR
jgi:cysteine synthase